MKVTKAKQETSEVINQRLKKSKLNMEDVVIPIVVIIVLILLSAFVFVPMVKSAIDFRNESKDINKKMESLDKLEKGLEEIDNTLLQADLIVAKKVIPNSLKVSDFIYYIDSLANSKNLSSRELTASDVKVVTGGDSENPDYTFAVNGPLSYTGSFESVLGFLDELQMSSPYIVSVEDISLTKTNDGRCSISLNVTGYYIPEITETFDLYGIPFSPYTKYEETMTILREKAAKLED